MKNTLIITAIFILISASISAQTRKEKTVSGETTEQQILALNKIWADSYVKNDVAALEQLLDDDIIITATNGSTRGKAGEIDDAKPNPNIKTYFFNTEDVRVRVYGGAAAVVIGTAKWRINVSGRGDRDFERRYLSVYAKKEDGWKMVAMHITRSSTPPNAN